MSVDPREDHGFRRTRRFWLAASVLCGTAVCCWTVFPVVGTPQFSEDDYRYLAQVQTLRLGFWDNIVDASIVENRWDHLWWIDGPGVVRFFRPTVVISYWLDARVHGLLDARGMVLTNIAIYLACAWVVAFLLHAYVGPGVPSLLGTALFAAFASHDTVVWYLAGRTDSLAALAFLAGLALHLSGYSRRRLSWLALPCYAVALVTKELTVGLPLVCLVMDSLRNEHSTVRGLVTRRLGLYTGYGLVGVAAFVMRTLALADGSDLVFPYFVSPSRPMFWSHLWTQVRTYSENVLLGTDTPEFMQPTELGQTTSLAGLWIGVVAFGGLLWLVRRDRRAVLPVVMGLVCWIPVSFVYISERYLFLPSVAVACLAALALDAARRRPGLYVGGAILVVAWAAHQGHKQRVENDFWMNRPRQMQIMSRQLEALEGRLAKGARVLVVNMPGNWLHAQFAEEFLQVRFEDPSLSARVVSVMPPIPTASIGPRVRQESDRTLLVLGERLDGNSLAPVLFRGEETGGVMDEFPWVDLTTGARFDGERVGFTVEVLLGQSSSCGGLRVHLEESLENYTVLRWVLHPDTSLSYYDRFRLGKVEIVGT